MFREDRTRAFRSAFQSAGREEREREVERAGGVGEFVSAIGLYDWYVKQLMEPNNGSSDVRVENVIGSDGVRLRYILHSAAETWHATFRSSTMIRCFGCRGDFTSRFASAFVRPRIGGRLRQCSSANFGAGSIRTADREASISLIAFLRRATGISETCQPRDGQQVEADRESRRRFANWRGRRDEYARRLREWIKDQTLVALQQDLPKGVAMLNRISGPATVATAYILIQEAIDERCARATRRSNMTPN